MCIGVAEELLTLSVSYLSVNVILLDTTEIAKHIRNVYGTFESKPYILIDGTQSIGIEPFYVQEIQADFVTCSVHKWLLSPYGCSILYLNPKHHDSWQPLDQHDRNRLGNDEPEWVEISGMHSLSIPVYPTTFQWGARCISAGGRPNPIILPMVSSALDMISEILGGPSTILTHVSKLTEEFLRLIQTDDDLVPIVDKNEAYYSRIGILVLPRQFRSKHIIGLSFHPSISISTREICQRLGEVGIKVSVRQSYLRISPYIYNTLQQVKNLYSQLRRIIHSGGKSQIDNSLVIPYCPRQIILIIGGSAWLGQYVFKHLRLSNYEIHVTYCTNRPHFLPPQQTHRVDLTNLNSDQPEFEKIDELISSLHPTVVIHLAAQSSLVKCDRDPEAAAQVNCPIPLMEAIQLHIPHALFLYTSTDLVYDGTNPPFHPSGPSILPTPSTTYGKTKLQFESTVLSLSHGLIFRLSNMIGCGYVYEASSQGGMKFLQWLQKNYLLKSKISLKFDEFRSFVSVYDVASLIQTVVDQYLNGNLGELHECWNQRVYNVGGPIGLSRLHLARILSEVQDCDLIVENENKTAENKMDGEDKRHHRSQWHVSSVASEALRSPNPQDTIPPKDVTMDSSLTEMHFGVKFHNLQDMLPSILAEM